MEEKALTIKLWSTPSDSVAFFIVKDGAPAEGAKVTLCTKGIYPLTFTKIADVGGKVVFKDTDILPASVPPDAFKEIPWLFMAYMEESQHGIWRDDVKYELKKAYTYTLKKYTTVPTFFIKIKLRDIIGVELFSTFVADVESSALEWAGLEVVKVAGKGTRTITIHFKLPWHESPLVISWTAVWFILKVMAVAGAIIAVLVILKWTFGKTAPAVTGLGIGAVIIFLLLTAPKPKRREERR